MRPLTRLGVSLRVASAALLVLLVSTTPAPADVIILPASRDNTLIENLSGSLSNGAGNAFFAGRTGQRSGSIRRGLIAFDVGSVIPPGATITNAILTLHMSMTRGGGTHVNLHRVASDWGEGASLSSGAIGAPAAPGDATWFHRFFSDRFWALPGGDFVSAFSATTIVKQFGFYSWGSTDDMVADVQSWLDEPVANFGWMLLGDERTRSTAKRFDSRESFLEARRPALMIEFSAPCTKSTGAPGAGYWRRQCLGIPADGGGLDPAPNGLGPGRLTEEAFVDQVLPCAESALADLGFAGIGACGAIGDRPPGFCHPNALRRLTTLVFNVCAGRLSMSCPVNDGVSGCGAQSIGGLIDGLAGRILAGDCLGAIRCSGE